MAAKAQKKKRIMKKKKKKTIQTLFTSYRKRAYGVSADAAQGEALIRLGHAYRNSGLVLYVGAGVSISIGLPSWPELVQALTVRSMSRRFHSALGAIENMDEYFALYQSFMRTLDQSPPSDRPILMLARSLKGELKSDLGREIARALYRRVGVRFPEAEHIRNLRLRNRARLYARAKPRFNLDLLDAIAKLARFERAARGVQAIINYNYDDLLEEYLQFHNIKCKAILSGKDVVDDSILPSYHVHGLIRYRAYRNYIKNMRVTRAGIGNPNKYQASEGNFVFSEDEYHEEYADAYRWSNLTQMSHFGRHTGLLIGLSLKDPNIRRLIDVTHKQYPDTQNFAVLCRNQSLKTASDSNGTVVANLFEEVETEALKGMGITPIWVDNHSEIPTLLGRIVDGNSS